MESLPSRASFAKDIAVFEIALGEFEHGCVADRTDLEGTPAESYVEYDNRHGFHNAHEFAALYPDDTRPSFGYCLPLAEPGMPELSVIRARLFERPRRSAIVPLLILACT